MTKSLMALVLLTVARIGWIQYERHTYRCMPFSVLCVDFCTVLLSLSYSFVSEISQENSLATSLKVLREKQVL